MNPYVQKVLTDLEKRCQHEPEFIQAARLILTSVSPVIDKHPEYEKAALLESLMEPERIISFRVPWIDDQGKTQINRAWRVQYNSAIGPYKGGIRFHPSVTMGTLKFLALEQTLKNALTGLPLGGGKGGSDFNPHGKSDAEVMRFCQSLMNELYRYLGEDTDVPAGDIGVGAREVGYMFGQYKRLKNKFVGVFTGKGLSFGGSNMRPEATGFGLSYLTQAMLKTINQSFNDKRVVISGSGNVAIYAAQKVAELGATVVAMSDSDGYVVDEEGIKLDWLKDLKFSQRARISRYPEMGYGQYFEGCQNIWTVPCDIALPCATQNELSLVGAKALVQNGVIAVSEGANMPTTPDAITYLQQNGVLFAPGKAANAGGVSVSGLEMSQNSLRLSWSREEIDIRLHDIMQNIFKSVQHAAQTYAADPKDYETGANIAGFVKVAEAMMAQGAV
ncbi:MAG TPA: NADP-specific glutamate dehydrogenase [Clostridiales bacterium]|jgi:glutamate dehydrogenase (NADP+)|nr:NADP-specific glutamate dehydrogenase [Clostridiales bacterium]